jgi:hypothetical protein
VRSLAQARQRARELRDVIGLEPGGLLERTIVYLADKHELDVTPVSATVIDGSRAEIAVGDACIYFDARLDHDLAEKLVVVSHELGHIELHPRLSQGGTHALGSMDPVLGSAYLADGAGAIARYSGKTREEAEANAFATEFVCPSDVLLDVWRRDPGAALVDLARQFQIPLSLVRAQLAEALYGLAIGPDGTAPRAPRPEQPPNERQYAAATHIGSSVVVNAGPGTGKTATIVHRIAFLLNERRANPESVLVLTFSNDAAEELRDRVAARFGDAVAARVEILTFHAFGLQFLRLHGQFAAVSHDAVVLDEAGQAELVERVIADVPCDAMLDLYAPAETIAAIVEHINFLKDRGIDADAFAGLGAIGSAFVYLLDLTPARGVIGLLDHDVVETSNLNRSPLFSATHVIGRRGKIDAAAAHLDDKQWTIERYAGRWRDHWPAVRRAGYDVWIALVNEDAAWAEMPFQCPPVIIHGTTTHGWGFGMGRHVPGRDDCTLCRMPQPAAVFRGPCAEGDVAPAHEPPVVASLPFLSSAAAALVFADLLAGRLYPDVERSNDVAADLRFGFPAVVSSTRRATSTCRGCRALAVGLGAE